MKKYDKHYWLTPPEIYQQLDDEFHFDFDPCPYPKPNNFNSLKMEWGKSNYINPPYQRIFGDGKGPTAWVHKGIEEWKKGKTCIFMLPVRLYVDLLLRAGAELRPMGRIKWLEVKTKEPQKAPVPICCFILRGKKKNNKLKKIGPN